MFGLLPLAHGRPASRPAGWAAYSQFLCRRRPPRREAVIIILIIMIIIMIIVIIIVIIIIIITCLIIIHVNIILIILILIVPIVDYSKRSAGIGAETLANLKSGGIRATLDPRYSPASRRGQDKSLFVNIEVP